jgi:hypothetical protein
LGYLWDGMSQKLEMSRLLADLDRELQFTQTMQTEMLDQQLQYQLQVAEGNQSYGVVLEKIVGKFFAEFLGQQGSAIQALTQAHLNHLHGRLKG